MQLSSSDDEQQQRDDVLIVGGWKGHVREDISGNILELFRAYRWKPIPNCTGRYTCRDHAVVSSLTPLELLLGCANMEHPASPWKQWEFRPREGRDDTIWVVPLDEEYTTGLITYQKTQSLGPNRYVHTLNTKSGFRRKLEVVGIYSLDDENHVVTKGQVI
jgi:hypothetical protein